MSNCGTWTGEPQRETSVHRNRHHVARRGRCNSTTPEIVGYQRVNPFLGQRTKAGEGEMGHTHASKKNGEFRNRRWSKALQPWHLADDARCSPCRLWLAR